MLSEKQHNSHKLKIPLELFPNQKIKNVYMYIVL